MSLWSSITTCVRRTPTRRKHQEFLTFGTRSTFHHLLTLSLHHGDVTVYYTDSYSFRKYLQINTLTTFLTALEMIYIYGTNKAFWNALLRRLGDLFQGLDFSLASTALEASSLFIAFYVTVFTPRLLAVFLWRHTVRSTKQVDLEKYAWSLEFVGR